MKNATTLLMLLLPALGVSACGAAPPPAANQAPATTTSAPAKRTPAPASAHAHDGATHHDAASAKPGATTPMTVDTTLPVAIVHKQASCGCCGLWVDHLRQAGFRVEVHDEADVNPIKERLGVPYGKGSCHTARIGDYFVEGHVPAADIKRLLADQPDAKGLVLPGMPLGSPGMEVPDGTVQPYTVELVKHDGSTVPFAEH